MQVVINSSECEISESWRREWLVDTDQNRDEEYRSHHIVNCIDLLNLRRIY